MPTRARGGARRRTGASRRRRRRCRRRAASPSQGRIELAYRANLESRLASRILWQVGHGTYRDEHDIYALAARARLAALVPRRPHACASTSPRRARRVHSLEFATLRIKDAVCDRHRAVGGMRPSISKDRPDVRVHAYLTADRRHVLSRHFRRAAVQARTAPRNRRRAAARESRRRAVAPRATGNPARRCSIRCAAAGRSRIEAALIALDIAPGLEAHVRLPETRLVRRADVAAHQAGGTAPRKTARQRPASTPATTILSQLGAVQRQSRRRRVWRAAVAVEHADVAGARRARAAAGIIVSNPPYGVRLADAGCAGGVLSATGRRAQATFCRLDRVSCSAPIRACAKLIGLKASRRTPLFNGALECGCTSIASSPARTRAGASKAGPAVIE